MDYGGGGRRGKEDYWGIIPIWMESDAGLDPDGGAVEQVRSRQILSVLGKQDFLQIIVD